MNHKSRIIRQNSRARTRFPLIGKLRCGEKRENKAGKEYPVSLDYFKATGDYTAKFNEAYPDKPSVVQIVFISDDDWESCYEEYDARDGLGRRAGYGDGETFFLFNPQSNEYDPTQDKGKVERYTKEHSIKWKPILTLNFLVPKIRGVFGIWQFQTSGDKSSIAAIRSIYDEIKEQAGTVVNIPFDLTVKKVTSNKPGSKSVYPVVNLIPNISTENVEQLRAFLQAGQDVKRLGMLTEEKMKALSEPDKIAEARAEVQPVADKLNISDEELDAALNEQAKETPPKAIPGKLFPDQSPVKDKHD